MNITKKRLNKIKKTRNQSKKQKNPKYKKKRANKKRRSFRKRKKNNIRKRSMKKFKFKRRKRRKIMSGGAEVNQIIKKYDKFYVGKVENKLQENNAMESKMLHLPISIRKIKLKDKNDANKLPELWQIINSIYLLWNEKDGKIPELTILTDIQNFKDFMNDINKKTIKFKNLKLYTYEETTPLLLYKYENMDTLEKYEKNRLDKFEIIFKDITNQGGQEGGGKKDNIFSLVDQVEKTRKKKADERSILEENIDFNMLNFGEKANKYKEKDKAMKEYLTPIKSKLKTISENYKKADNSKENAYQSKIRLKQKLTEFEKNIEQDLIENSSLPEEDKEKLKNEINKEYSTKQNKILNQKQKHDYARANKKAGVGMINPRQGPTKGQGTFSTDNYFKPSTDKLNPNDSDFMPKPIRTWGIQMDPQRNGLFAHINIRANHPYQLDKENIVINKFLKHDTPEWLQFVGDSLTDRHKVDGFDGTPWHWPHKEEEEKKGESKGEAPAGKDKDEAPAGKGKGKGEKTGEQVEETKGDD